MIISHENRWIFLSNPKCASTTLRSILTPHQSWAVSSDDPHVTSAQVMQHFDTWHWNIDVYRKWTTIRHPAARLYSLHKFKHRMAYSGDTTNATPRFIMVSRDYVARYPTFEAAVLDLNEFGPSLQTHYTHLNDEPFCEDIARVETLSTDLQPIFNRLGLEVDDLPRLNVSDASDWESQYTPQMRQIVLNRYADDFRLLGYDW